MLERIIDSWHQNYFFCLNDPPGALNKDVTYCQHKCETQSLTLWGFWVWCVCFHAIMAAPRDPSLPKNRTRRINSRRESKQRAAVFSQRCFYERRKSKQSWEDQTGPSCVTRNHMWSFHLIHWDTDENVSTTCWRCRWSFLFGSCFFYSQLKGWFTHKVWMV